MVMNLRPRNARTNPVPSGPQARIARPQVVLRAPDNTDYITLLSNLRGTAAKRATSLVYVGMKSWTTLHAELASLVIDNGTPLDIIAESVSHINMQLKLAKYINSCQETSVIRSPASGKDLGLLGRILTNFEKGRCSLEVVRQYLTTIDVTTFFEDLATGYSITEKKTYSRDLVRYMENRLGHNGNGGAGGGSSGDDDDDEDDDEEEEEEKKEDEDDDDEEEEQEDEEAEEDDENEKEAEEDDENEEEEEDGDEQKDEEEEEDEVDEDAGRGDDMELDESADEGETHESDMDDVDGDGADLGMDVAGFEDDRGIRGLFDENLELGDVRVANIAASKAGKEKDGEEMLEDGQATDEQREREIVGGERDAQGAEDRVEVEERQVGEEIDGQHMVEQLHRDDFDGTELKEEEQYGEEVNQRLGDEEAEGFIDADSDEFEYFDASDVLVEVVPLLEVPSDVEAVALPKQAEPLSNEVIGVELVRSIASGLEEKTATVVVVTEDGVYKDEDIAMAKEDKAEEKSAHVHNCEDADAVVDVALDMNVNNLQNSDVTNTGENCVVNGNDAADSSFASCDDVDTVAEKMNDEESPEEKKRKVYEEREDLKTAEGELNADVVGSEVPVPMRVCILDSDPEDEFEQVMDVSEASNEQEPCEPLETRNVSFDIDVEVERFMDTSAFDPEVDDPEIEQEIDRSIDSVSKPG